MADFPPSLDDSEFFLPSDIYPLQNPTTQPPEIPEFPSELTYMQDLADQLAQHALRENIVSQQTHKPPPNAPQFGPVHLLPNGFGRGGYHASFVRGGAGFGDGLFHPGSGPVYPACPVKPFPAQMESFVQGRARGLQRRQHQQNPVRDRFVPVRLSNGPARGTRGTGVFLPRVLVSPENRKKPTMKRAEHAPPTRYAAVKQGLSFQHPPADMGLPQDWTY